MIGTDRMFEEDEIRNFAESNGLSVIAIKEVVFAHPDDKIQTIKELVVVLQK